MHTAVVEVQTFAGGRGVAGNLDSTIFSPATRPRLIAHNFRTLRGCHFSSFAALVYTMDELDPYRDMPISSKEDLALDASEYSTETSGMNGGVRGHADMPPARTDNGLGYGGQGGHTVLGRREGAPLSAQASYLAVRLFPADAC